MAACLVVTKRRGSRASRQKQELEQETNEGTHTGERERACMVVEYALVLISSMLLVVLEFFNTASTWFRVESRGLCTGAAENWLLSNQSV